MKNHFLKNKIIVVTGASSGIGKEIALEAAKCGAILIVCGRREVLLESIKNECEQLSGNRAYAFKLDLNDNKSIGVVFEKIKNTVGNIDILVNSAGFGNFINFIDFDLELAKNMFQVNLIGLITLTQKIAKLMYKNKSGHIINICSQAGKMSTPQSSIYSATKFGVLGFTNAIRLELKDANIFVTSVNTGPVDTEFFDTAGSDRAYVDKVSWIILNANEVAKKVVKNMGKNKREINLPFILEFGAKFYSLFPKIGDFIARKIFL